MSAKAKPEPDAEVETVSARIGAIQRRKSEVNIESAKLRRALDVLQTEAEDLAKEHLGLLRKFDSVAKLP